MHIHDSDKLMVYHIISGDLWAGAETMAFNLLSCLKDLPDLELTVILLNEGMLADKLREIGIRVHVIDESRYSLPEIIAKTRNIIGDFYPDLIHSHRYKENLIAFLITLFKSRVRLVSTLHGLPEQLVKKAGIFQRLKMKVNFLILSRCFITVAVSEDIRNVLVSQFGFRKKMMEVIHNGILLPALDTPSGRPGRFVIGSSGRLFPVKDYPLLVNVASTVSSTGIDDVQFELAGDGPEMPTLDALVKSHGLTANFDLRGHLDDMGSFYRGLDAYINTSIHEGIPMTILEALSHGLPVIAPAVGGIVEIIEDGKDGFLIKSRDPRDFADKCLLLREDVELRQRMSRAAREKAEKAFSAGIMAEKYFSLYRKTCSIAE